ncbi:MAG: Hpt domain-containing protein [Sumerlaeia bacterium]
MTINPDLSIFDRRRVDELAEGDEEFIADLLGGFLDDLSSKIQSLQTTAAADVDSIRKIAHTMKGACLNIGAEKLAASFSKLEVSPEKWEQLKEEINQTVAVTSDKIKDSLH